MSITQEEAAVIRSEQAFLRDQVTELVGALHDNTQKVGEMLSEMKVRDKQDEYREKEFGELKEKVTETNERITDYIKTKEPIVEWAERRKKFYDSLWASITSTWGKILAGAAIVGLAYVLGIDITKLMKG